MSRPRVPRDADRTVWSSETGDLRNHDERDHHARPNAPSNASAAKRRAQRGEAERSQDRVIRVKREVAGRRGKPVTTIYGLPLSPRTLVDLAGELKKRCGSGGSAKNGVIELQGDHRTVVIAELEARGYTVKRAGG